MFSAKHKNEKPKMIKFKINLLFCGNDLAVWVINESAAHLKRYCKNRSLDDMVNAAFLITYHVCVCVLH